MINLSPEQIDALYNNGHISQEVYNKIVGIPEVPMTPQAPSPQVPMPQILPENMNTRALEAKDAYIAQNGGSGFLQAPTTQPRHQGETGFLQGPVAPQQQNPAASIAPVGLDKKEAPKKQTASLNLASDQIPQSMGSSMGSKGSPYDQAYDQQIAGVNQGADVSSIKTNEQAEMLNRGIEDQANLELERQQNEGRRQQELQTRISDLDKATQEAASMTIEPNRFWSNKDTGGKILTGVALALGSFGSTPDNKVVGLITSAIDKDIALQKWQIANARDNLNPKLNLLNQMRGLFGDERQAEDATRIAALEKVKLQIMQKAMQYSAPEVKAAALKATGELELEKQKARQSFIAGAANGGVGTPITFSEKMSLQKDIGERTIAGLGIVSDAREAPKIREMKGIVDPLRSNITDLVKISEEGSSWIPFSARSRKASVLATDTMLQLKELANLGVLQKADLEQLEKMIPADPTAVLQTNAHTKLVKAKELIERRWKGFIEARGLKDPTLIERKRD